MQELYIPHNTKVCAHAPSLIEKLQSNSKVSGRMIDTVTITQLDHAAQTGADPNTGIVEMGVYNLQLATMGMPLVNDFEFTTYLTTRGYQIFHNGIQPVATRNNRIEESVRAAQPNKQINWGEYLRTQIAVIDINNYAGVSQLWQADKIIISDSLDNPHRVNCLNEVEDLLELARIKIKLECQSQQLNADIAAGRFDNELEAALRIYNRSQWMTKDDMLRLAGLVDSGRAINRWVNTRGHRFKAGGPRPLTSEQLYDSYYNCVVVTQGKDNHRIWEQQAALYGITDIEYFKSIVVPAEVSNAEIQQSNDPVEGVYNLLVQKLAARANLDRRIKRGNSLVMAGYGNILARRRSAMADIARRQKRNPHNHPDPTPESVIQIHKGVISTTSRNLEEIPELKGVESKTLVSTAEAALRTRKAEILASTIVNGYIQNELQGRNTNPDKVAAALLQNLSRNKEDLIATFPGLIAKPYENYFGTLAKYQALLEGYGMLDHKELIKKLPTLGESMAHNTLQVIKYTPLVLLGVTLATVSGIFRHIVKPLFKEVLLPKSSDFLSDFINGKKQ